MTVPLLLRVQRLMVAPKLVLAAVVLVLVLAAAQKLPVPVPALVLVLVGVVRKPVLVTSPATMISALQSLCRK